MGGLPDIVVVIDTNKESIAVREAQKLGIPVVAVVDSNSDPRGITFPIPGNDDAMRSIALYCSLFSDAVLDGLQQEALSSGVDLGADPAAGEGVEEAAEANEEVVAEAQPEAEETAAAADNVSA